VEHGRHAELMRKKGLYAKLVKMQFLHIKGDRG
jgi:ABC-type multidrug transport system fused ATPase/permease subunit